VDVLGDVYVAVFATVMFGSMLANVVLNVGRVSDELCVTRGCHEARSLLPWTVALAVLVVTLALSRLLGPVFVTPAVGSWLLPTPVDRAELLRPRLVKILVICVLGVCPIVAAAAVLAGFGVGPTVGLVGVSALLGVAGVSLVALAQRRQGPVARLVTWSLALALWATLLTLATRRLPLVGTPEVFSTAWLAVLLAAGVAAVIATVRALRSLAHLRDRAVTPGGQLAPGLSGALASLDLALLFDVLLAHRWRRHDAVRPRRGGPSGLGALLWTDLTRLRRAPQPLVTLAAVVVVPYAGVVAGAGRIVVLVAALAGFLATLPLLSGLRVLVRTPGLARLMPFSVARLRWAVLVVPTGLAVLFGLACGPAVGQGLEVPAGAGLLLGLAVGLSGLASAVRWVTGRPPDYSRPLVSTPAGGVPTNLYGSAVRGFDVLLLTTAPMLLAPTVRGGEASLLLTAVVLAYLTGRR